MYLKLAPQQPQKHGPIFVQMCVCGAPVGLVGGGGALEAFLCELQHKP